jgi:hypothetical protein
MLRMPSVRHVSQLYSPRFLLPACSAAVLLALYGVSACAADIARDTPAASMALATGLYAAPGPSAAVSTVTTPVVTASPLPPDAPPQKISPAAPAVVSVPPASSNASVTTEVAVAHQETGWSSYVAIVAGLVGAIAGIAGAIMGGLGLRRVNRLMRRD